MKKTNILLFLVLLTATYISAQTGNIGVATVAPTSKLHVEGSLATGYRAVDSSTVLDIHDYAVEFNGESDDSLKLPDASTCKGRIYMIKNVNVVSGSIARIVTTSNQTIDNAIGDTINGACAAMYISNGADWKKYSSAGTPGADGLLSSGTAIGNTTYWDGSNWVLNSNSLYNDGSNVGVGTSTFDVANPEKFVVDAGNTTSVNAIVGKGNINNYLQLNIRNTSNGTSASSDVVATADNGSEVTNFIDLGINGSGNNAGIMGVANDAYIYNVGQDLLIGTATDSKSIQFLTGGTNEATNERMRIDGDGNVGIGTISASYSLDVNGTIRTGKSSTTNGSMVFSNNSNNRTVTINSGVTSASYSLTLPTLQAEAGQVLSNNGSGALSWVDLASGPTGATGSVGATGADGATGAIGAVGMTGATGGTGATGVAGDRYSTTSVTSFTIPTVSVTATFTVGTGLAYTINQTVVVTPTSVTTDLFRGTVTSYNINTGSITVQCNSTSAAGSSYSSWTVNLDGATGTAGATGATGSTGAAGATGATGVAGVTGATGSDGASNAWGLTGTSGTSFATNFIGTIDNKSLRVRTNNAERLVIDSLGNARLGSSTTVPSYSTFAEKLLVDCGTTSSVNAIVARGNINNYLQVNVQNLSSGASASSDIVATANNGDESNNYIDMGINGSGNTSAIMGGPNDSYIYNTGGDMFMGAGTAGKAYVFLTGGTDPSTNERMRISGTGNIGIGNSNPTYKLDVNGTIGLGKASSTNGVLVFRNNTNANTLTLNSGITTTSYSLTLPTSQGSANTVLTNNGSGNLSWSSVSSPTVIVAAARTSSYTTSSSYSTVVYASTSTNVGTAYNTTSGVFTAPATGTYQFIINNNYSCGTGQNDALTARLIVNSITDMETSFSSAPYSSPGINQGIVLSEIVTMTSGQTATVQVGGLVGSMTPLVSTGQHTLKIVRLN